MRILGALLAILLLTGGCTYPLRCSGYIGCGKVRGGHLPVKPQPLPACTAPACEPAKG